MHSMKIKIADVIIPKRLRQADTQKVREIADSIERLGLLNPITISSKKELIAGLHRLEAHKLLGREHIEARIKDFDDFKRELAEIDENLVRNELSILEQGEMILQRDELLASLNVRAKSGNNRGKTVALETNESIASEIGISKRTLQERKQVARNIIPEVRDRLRGTRYADNAHGLVLLARQTPEIQRIVVEKIFSKDPDRSLKVDANESLIINRAIHQAHREHRCNEKIKEYRHHPIPYSIQVHHGEFQKVCKGIPDGSVDLVLTDPPYKTESLHLYKDLAEASYRLLKPSGFIVTYLGVQTLPQIINYFLDAGFSYHWTGVIKFKHANNWTRVWERRVFSLVRLYLVFYKPPRTKKLKFFKDFIEGEGREKDFHEYQQSLDAFKYLATKFSEPGDLVLEPFGGSGTTAIACHEEGRRCIIVEKERKSFQIIKSRIAEHFSGKKQSREKAANSSPDVVMTGG